MKQTLASVLVKTIKEEIGREDILIEELSPEDRQATGQYHLGYVDALRKVLEDIKLLTRNK